MHIGRPNAPGKSAYIMDDDVAGQMTGYLTAMRGIQAGGLTAAGLGLYGLSQQFGGPADRPSPSELDPMQPLEVL